MAHVVLQPSGNPVAREHYAETIDSPVPLDLHEDLIDPVLMTELRERFPSGLVPMWGVTPGKNDVNVPKYSKALAGDVVLFAADGRIFGCGTIAAKFHNHALAARLWSFDANGRTWEYMYALDEIRSLDIDYITFNRTVGYDDGNIIQGFTVMNEERSDKFLDAFNLWSQQYEADVSDDELNDAVNGLDGPLDRQVKSWARAEQAKARSVHLGGRQSGTCRLCDREFPRQFLVAAHKKKRSQCSDEEKRDIKNVTMLCCLFGCDALYERGLVAVAADGTVLHSDRLVDDSAVGTYVRDVMASRISLNDAERAYFEWHQGIVFA